MAKSETQLQYYKKKYTECVEMFATQKEQQNLRTSEKEKEVEHLNSKIKKYITQYSFEKEKTIQLELLMSSKDFELNDLRNTKKKLEVSLGDSEVRCSERDKQIETFKQEIDDFSNNNYLRGEMTQFNENSGFDLLNSINKDQVETFDEENQKCLMQKDIDLLNEKYKTLEKENEMHMIRNEEIISKLLKDNEELKEEIKRTTKENAKDNTRENTRENPSRLDTEISCYDEYNDGIKKILREIETFKAVFDH